MKRFFGFFAIVCMCVLAGCSPRGTAETAGTIEISGSFGAPVAITITEEPVVSDVTSTVVTNGDGPLVVAGGPLLLRATSFDSRTGELVAGYDTGEIRLTTADDEGVGELANSLVGLTEGSRVLIERPGLSRSDESAVEIVVVDILLTSAHGSEGTSADTLASGNPSYSVSDDGVPQLGALAGAVDGVSVTSIIAGTGEQLDADDTIAMQYLIADSSGTVVDSTWTTQAPVAVNLADVMSGLREGLTDQSVGSRVLIRIPSEDAAGDGDRLAVVDILAVLPEGENSAQIGAD